MDQEHITQLTRSLFKAMNERDFVHFTEIMADEVAFDFPGAGRVEGQRRTILLLKSIFRKYPVLEFRVHEIVAGTARACCIWTNSGESASGEPYSNSGVTLLHFKEGKITFISDYFKDTSFTS